jgi:hypothetical protein
MKKYIQREEYAKLKASLAANPRWLEREDDSDVRAVPATREGSSFDGRNASIPLDAAPHSERPPLPPERLHRPADRLLGWLAGTAWKKEHRIGLLSQYPPRPMRLERFPKPRVRSGKLPSIAVVTPSFMQGHFIERTILSVIDQNYPDLRYAVQDAGSTDETQEIIRRHAARIASWSSEPDTGQARAICNGFEKIDGEIMSWLNSDDTLMPGALRCVGEFFHKHPEVDAVYGHRVLIDEDDREVARWVLPPHDNEVLRWADYVPQETLFWRRKLWDAVGGVDPKFRFAIDWDLILRFQHAGARIVRLPYFLGCFRVHASQKTSAQSDSVGAEEVGYLRWREHGCDPHWQDMNKVLRLIESRSAVCARLLAMGVRI